MPPSGRHRGDEGEIGLAHRLELGRAQARGPTEGNSSIPSLSVCSRLSSPAPWTIGCEARICSIERRARARHADNEDGQVRARAQVRLRREKRGREDLRDARHPALVRVRVVGKGRALEPVALVVVAERLFGVADVEEGLAEAEMQRRAIGERDPLAREQRLHLGRSADRPGAKRLRSVWLNRMPGELGKALAASSIAFIASALRPNSMKSAPRLAIASSCAGPGSAAARS